MPILELGDGSDPRLQDFSHRTDVGLRRAAPGAPHGVFLAESALVLERALQAGFRPRAAIALRGHAEEAARLLGGAVPVFAGEPEAISALTGYLLHREVVAAFDRPELPDPAALLAGARRVVVIEDVVDPTNVGAIFRSVAGIGADAVLVTPRCADPFYRRAIRVSMGTVLQVPWTRAPEWPELVGLLRGAGFQVAALALTPQAVDLRDYRAPERVALVLGTEGAGLTPAALAAADVHLRIPMRHGVDSLNVAAAAAVAIWALA